MSWIFDELGRYWQFDFFRYALIVGVVIALCSSLLGVMLVLKRLSFIGDGLSHVAFGALAVSGVLGVLFKGVEERLPEFLVGNDMPFVLLITIICAVLLLRRGQNAKINGDAAIAMLSVGALAMGYLLMNIFAPSSSNISGDVCSTLFGSTSILTLTLTEVRLSVILSFTVVVLFVLFYNRIFQITFDEDFSRATGVNTRLYNLVVAVIVAIIIVLAMNLVGSLLTSALIIFPALCAMRVFKSFFRVTICSAIVSVSCALIGIVTATLAGTPVGSTIVAVNIVFFAIFCAAGKICASLGK